MNMKKGGFQMNNKKEIEFLKEEIDNLNTALDRIMDMTDLIHRSVICAEVMNVKNHLNQQIRNLKNETNLKKEESNYQNIDEIKECLLETVSKTFDRINIDWNERKHIGVWVCEIENYITILFRADFDFDKRYRLARACAKNVREMKKEVEEEV